MYGSWLVGWLVGRSILMIGEDVGYSTGFERDDAGGICVGF